MSKHDEHIEMDLAFGSAKQYGSSRSIVRRIASNLPLKPCARVHFQLYPYTEDAGVLSRKNNFAVASLADVSWIDQDEEEEEDDEDNVGRPRLGPPPTGLAFRIRQSNPQRKPRLARRCSLPSLHEVAPDPQGPSATNNEAIQKISALETELAKLRAQIAQIVLAQEKSTQSGTTPHPPPPPCGTGPPPPPPPPPPLPPPPPPLNLQRTFSAIDLIKERRGKKTEGQTTVLESKTAEIPSMLDILKDMNKVKLRSVKSRPAELDTKEKVKEPTDAATLIAEALKRKFAHRYRHDSDQDDQDVFTLPDHEVKSPVQTPLFGQHMLKSTGKRTFV
ncbi:mitochondrial fission regulator 1 [Nerophis lumbriciformis]|uniref:mitochondrial fission regulator 1 n=1 Tax=Nerophis lumbriciformis TaxID=546530 RepID=UPI002ADF10CB|nr:mitochondrial fission regulator 1 [Nerophis lumbriciformis]XP_061821359.1 mitochondrial fission regulator 1 [Nerophis lumbriciformis]XP_061821360.1 mitochondrial fission regulator 1 [Nerophis lumbriciformis]